jgi:hypothetical protein
VYYSDAKDGWHIDAGGTLRCGVTGGIAFGRTELVAGVRRQETE